jgi:hypothetical protein
VVLPAPPVGSWSSAATPSSRWTSNIAYKYGNDTEKGALFTLSERGIVTLTDECRTNSTPSPTGNDRYQKPGSEAWYDAMLEKIRTYNRIR